MYFQAGAIEKGKELLRTASQAPQKWFQQVNRFFRRITGGLEREIAKAFVKAGFPFSGASRLFADAGLVLNEDFEIKGDYVYPSKIGGTFHRDRFSVLRTLIFLRGKQDGLLDEAAKGRLEL